MPRTTAYDVQCPCGHTFTAVETIWPATRWDPADGEINPEECPQCGESVAEMGPEALTESEPPEPDYDQDDYDWDGP